MAKYDVTYKCTHEGTVELFGKTTDRMKKIEWMETTLCPECYAREQAQKANKGMQIEEVEMLYSEYKNNFSNCQTLPNSYDSKTKTITVLVPVEVEEVEEVTVAEETTETTVVENATVETTEEIITIEQISEMARSTVENAKKVVAMPIEKLEAIVQDLENKINATENPAERLLKSLKESKEMIDLIKRYKAQQ